MEYLWSHLLISSAMSDLSLQDLLVTRKSQSPSQLLTMSFAGLDKNSFHKLRLIQKFRRRSEINLNLRNSPLMKKIREILMTFPALYHQKDNLNCVKNRLPKCSPMHRPVRLADQSWYEMGHATDA